MILLIKDFTSNLFTKFKVHVKNVCEKLRDWKQLLKVFAIFSGALVLGLYVGGFLFEKTVVSVSPSLPYTIFRVTEKRSPQLGDYVNFRISPEDKFAGNQTLVKQVSCLGGRYYLVIIKELRDYYCCPKSWALSDFANFDLSQCTYLGRAKTTSKKGDKVDPYYPCEDGGIKIVSNRTTYDVCVYYLPERAYFVSGMHRDSYDSRYFGPITEEVIISILRPVF